MMRSVRAVGFVLVAAGCTASWNALVRYSAAPLVPGETAEVGVYATVLTLYSWEWEPASVVIADNVEPLAAHFFAPGGEEVIRRHWSDTLTSEVGAALRDTARARPGRDEAIRAAAGIIGIDLHAHSDLPRASGSAPIPMMWIWRPGFNADSTIAAIRVQFWCGTACAHESTILLARRPGRQWRIWHEVLRWMR
jgi:hypothetical protein